MNNFIPKLGLVRKAIEPSLAKFRRPPAETPKCEEETSQADKSLLLISKLPLLRREHLECDIFRAFRALDQSQCEPLLHNMPISKMRWVRGGKRGPHMNGYPQIPPPTPTHSTICIFPLLWVGGHCVSGRGWEWIRGNWGQAYEWNFLSYKVYMHNHTTTKNQLFEIQASWKSSAKFDLEQSLHSESFSFLLFLKTIQGFSQIFSPPTDFS